MSDPGDIGQVHGPRTAGAGTALWRNRRGRAGVILGGALVLLGLAAPMIASQNPLLCRYKGRLRFPAVSECLRGVPVLGRAVPPSRPFGFPGFNAREQIDRSALTIWPLIPHGPLEMTADVLAPPSRAHWLGTDDRGRDVASRLVHGARASVKVAVGAMILAAACGIAIGAAAGYCRGWVDWVLSRFIEVMICFPTFFLILSVMVWLKPDIDNVIIVIGLTQWTSIARLTRAEFLRLRQADFIVAAVGSGASSWRIAALHVLPCALAPVMVTVIFGVADAILLEAGISWLGFGVPPPGASWGNMLRVGYDHLRSAPHLVYPPCTAVFVSVLAFHLMGEAMRDRLDERSFTYRGWMRRP